MLTFSRFHKPTFFKLSNNILHVLLLLDTEFCVFTNSFVWLIWSFLALPFTVEPGIHLRGSTTPQSLSSQPPFFFIFWKIAIWPPYAWTLLIHELPNCVRTHSQDKLRLFSPDTLQLYCVDFFAIAHLYFLHVTACVDVLLLDSAQNQCTAFSSAMSLFCNCWCQARIYH